MASMAPLVPGLAACLAKEVVWEPRRDLDHPFGARVDGREWLLFLGDFPAEQLYTLIVDGVAVGSLDDWPPTWTRKTGGSTDT